MGPTSRILPRKERVVCDTARARGAAAAPRGRIGPCMAATPRTSRGLPGGTLADLITTGGHREMDGTELVAPINQHQQVSKEQSCRSCYRNHAKNGLLALIAVGVILCSALLWVTRGDLVHGFANEANILSGADRSIAVDLHQWPMDGCTLRQHDPKSRLCATTALCCGLSAESAFAAYNRDFG
jgi:hypothetical protein